MINLDENQVFLNQQSLRSRLYPHDGIWPDWDWRDTHISIVDLVQDQARRNPNNPAILDPSGAMSYGELDAASNRVANALIKARGSESEAIGIVAGIERYAVIMALGVLKAGKYFVCMALGFPISKQIQILEDSGIEALVTRDHYCDLAHSLAQGKRSLFFLEELPDKTASPGLDISPDSIAVIHYTSGSTGKPKGVIQTHQILKSQTGRYMQFYRVGPSDRCTFNQSLAWAGAFWTCLGTLCNGAALVLFDLNRLGPEQSIELMEKYRPTLGIGTTALKQIFGTRHSHVFPETRLISLGGDTIYGRDVEIFRQVFPNAVISISLGITEAGRPTSFLVSPNDPIDFDVAPVGYPLEGFKVYLLDEDLRQVPRGELGEIAVQDEFLALGYLNRPNLTKQRFRILEEFGDTPIYLTGDLGQLDTDGKLLHKGRKDFQVKIRGYQVHTSEIEGILLSRPGVNHACVVAKELEGGTKMLVAYLEVEPELFEGVQSVHKYLRDTQPLHMVPKHFAVVDKLPRTENGKIDRKALPIPEKSRALVEAAFREPRHNLDRELTKIWEGVLDLDLIGIDDDFIQLGGDSLISGQIINRVMDRFQLKLSYEDIFNTQTIADMSDLIIAREQVG